MGEEQLAASAQNTVILVEKEDKRLWHLPGSHSLVLPLMSGG